MVLIASDAVLFEMQMSCALGAGDSVTLTFSIERFYSSKEA